MRHLMSLLSIVAATALALGCAGNPEPGDPGYPYNVAGTYDAEFVVEGDVYDGLAELSTEPGGAVAGEFLTDEPATVVGAITGRIVGDRLSYAGTYGVREAGCEGTLDATGTVDEGGDRIAGDFATRGACGEMTGTFVFER